MSVEALSAHLKQHWPTIRVQLLDGSYEPQPVRRVEIPSQRAAFVRSACPRSSTASSSRRYCRFCKRTGTDVQRIELRVSARSLGASGD